MTLKKLVLFSIVLSLCTTWLEARFKQISAMITPAPYVQDHSFMRDWIFERDFDSLSGKGYNRTDMRWMGRTLSSGAVQVNLQRDRTAKILGKEGDSLGVWELKRKLVSCNLEVEVCDDAESPKMVFLYQVLVTPGMYQPSAVAFGKGTIYALLPPFWPWNKKKIGTFTVRLPALTPIVDASLR